MALSQQERPLVKPWIRVAHDGAALAFEHKHLTREIAGEASRELLPLLLGLLDGERSVQDVLALVGDDLRQPVASLLEVLSDHGLLTDSPAGWGDVSQPVREAASFLCSLGADDLTLAAVLERLASSSAAVVGSSTLASGIAILLEESGLHTTARTGWDAIDDQYDIYVVAPDGTELPALSSWNEQALRRDLTWCPVLPFNGTLGVVGPLYVRKETCCYRCFEIRRASNVEYGRWFWPLQESRAPYPSPPGFDALLGGLVVDMALRWLVLDDPSLPSSFLSVEIQPRTRVEWHRVYRVPRCPACSLVSSQPDPSPWNRAIGSAGEA